MTNDNMNQMNQLREKLRNTIHNGIKIDDSVNFSLDIMKSCIMSLSTREEKQFLVNEIQERFGKLVRGLLL